VNLGETKRDYRRMLDRITDRGGPGEEPAEDEVPEAQRRLGAVRDKAIRGIDEYTTRRFLPVNTRRDLTGKLDRLHQQPQAELKATDSDRQYLGTRT
jgi:hypothetical protein